MSFFTSRQRTPALLLSAFLLHYPGTLAEEMDLYAVLARSPAVALVDDLAHRNAPGSRHRTQWQDVEDLLAAGIEVLSTVSIGHLDSLADVVEKFTGLSRDSLQRHHRDKIVHLSPRRVGMTLRSALAIAKGE